MAEARPLLLCADDFGLSRGIDETVARLVRAGRLGAFSCIVNGPAWAADAPQVPALRAAGAQAGLHLNLTEGRPLAHSLAAQWPQLPALPRLLALSHLGRLPLAALRDELAAQWQAFIAATGRAPDFVDGHQHVHQLPGLRPLLLALLAAHAAPAPGKTSVPVRATAPLAGPGFGVKRWVIGATGGLALTRALQRAGLAHNRCLLGAYDFQAADYGALMRGWLARVPAGGALLFCHPGTCSADAPADVIAAAREREAAYLGSDQFPRDLAAAGVHLAPVWR